MRSRQEQIHVPVKVPVLECCVGESRIIHSPPDPQPLYLGIKIPRRFSRHDTQAPYGTVFEWLGTVSAGWISIVMEFYRITLPDEKSTVPKLTPHNLSRSKVTAYRSGLPGTFFIRSQHP